MPPDLNVVYTTDGETWHVHDRSAACGSSPASLQDAISIADRHIDNSAVIATAVYDADLSARLRYSHRRAPGIQVPMRLIVLNDSPQIPQAHA